MSRKFTKPFFAILAIAFLGLTAFAVAQGGFFFVGSTNTVTQVNYPTATATSVVTTTGTVTETGTPYETLTTTVVSGTQTYTTTITQTTGAVTTSTATASTDYYSPPAMYYTATTNNPFYEQLSPIVTTATDGTAFNEVLSGSPPGPSLAMSITTSSSTPPYYDLGFYYVFQNLAGGTLAAFNTHSITATGTAGPTISGGFATNLWINPQTWTWTPEGVGQDTFSSLAATGAYGLGSGALSIGGDTGTETVSSSSSFYITAAGTSSCLYGDVGTTVTVAAIITACGATTPFALWYGIVGPSAASTTASATVSTIYSTPYP